MAAHVNDVLANLDRQGLAPHDRRKLRLVAILHDAMKAEVDRSRPPAGDNHHAVRGPGVRQPAPVPIPDKVVIFGLSAASMRAWPP